MNFDTRFIHNYNFANRKKRVFEFMSKQHLQFSKKKKSCENKKTKILRLQNYVFSQNHVIVIIQNSNKTRTRYIFQCSRYDVKNKNIKKLTKKNKQRSNIKHQFFDCFYKVRLVYYKKTKK